MAKITGLGGIFYKVADPEKTRAWYQETLGIGGEWGAMFPFKQDAPDGFSLFSQFKADTDYFGPSDKPFMVNLRVDDLDGLVADLGQGDRNSRPPGRGLWPFCLDPRSRRSESGTLAAAWSCAGVNRSA